MAVQHTSGPWHVEDPLGVDQGDALWIVRDGATPEVYDWRCVAIVTSDDPEGGDNPLPVSAAERDANARLIAAAPDLLDALESALMQLRVAVITNSDGLFTHDNVHEHLGVAKIMAAIAKATGA